jgi:hypothetical protein
LSKESKKKGCSFNVLIGFNAEAGRWNSGDVVSESDISKSDIEALLEMGAIEEI